MKKSFALQLTSPLMFGQNRRAITLPNYPHVNFQTPATFVQHEAKMIRMSLKKKLVRAKVNSNQRTELRTAAAWSLATASAAATVPSLCSPWCWLRWSRWSRPPSSRWGPPSCRGRWRPADGWQTRESSVSLPPAWSESRKNCFLGCLIIFTK